LEPARHPVEAERLAPLDFDHAGFTQKLQVIRKVRQPQFKDC
jgi:hypothetical protein